MVPGLIALGLPTPHTTTWCAMKTERSTTRLPWCRRQVEEGRGLVPALRLDHRSGDGQADARTRTATPLLNYDMATPKMLLHYLPSGLLGLGLTALLACLMSGMAVSIMAFTTVFTCDLYQPYLRKDASDEHLVAVGGGRRRAGFCWPWRGYAAMRFNSIADALALVFALVNAPLLATFLLGMFWKRATGHGAFAGLIAGTAAAALHHGLTLPVEAQPGWQGGWIAAMHRYPSGLTQSFWTAVLAFSANLMVTVAVSLFTRARPEAELAGLVHGLTPQPKAASGAWWKRPEGLAAIILGAAIVASLIFA